MPLLRRDKKDSDAKVKAARRQVAEAVFTMTALLEKVEEQATEAKEQLDERRTG